MKKHSGYTGKSLEFLESIGAELGDTIEADTISGKLLRRYHGGRDKIIVLKLFNSYNVAVPIKRLENAIIHKAQKDKDKTTRTKIKTDPSLPKILFITTGGTIASRVDHVTGAAAPLLDASSLIDSVPELASIARIDLKVVLSEFSENILPEHWLEIANSIKDHANKYAGIVIAHGTDTMQYTASYLSFTLAGFPQPIVLVGSQRSSDRPSSDAAENLCAAARLAVSGACINGVYVAMHAGVSDGMISFHRGTRTRKLHTSSRGAFETIGSKPAFFMVNDTIRQNDNHNYFSTTEYTPRVSVTSKAVLLKYYPGMTDQLVDDIAKHAKIIILEGTGLGHVGQSIYDSLERAIKNDILVAMTSQCIEGEVNMNVYESGRVLQNIGIIPLRGMLSETALVKAMWALSLSNDTLELKELLLKPIASEFL